MDNFEKKKLYEEICRVWRCMYGPGYDTVNPMNFKDFEIIARHFYNKAIGEGDVYEYDLLGPPNEG